MKLTISTILVALALSSTATAQNYTITIQPDPFWSNYYAAQSAGGALGDIADQMQTQAMINSYRQAHGLPKCSAFPIFHWDGLPGC